MIVMRVEHRAAGRGIADLGDQEGRTEIRKAMRLDNIRWQEAGGCGGGGGERPVAAAVEQLAQRTFQSSAERSAGRIGRGTRSIE